MENELYSFVAKEFAFACSKQFPSGFTGSMAKNLKSESLIPPSFRYEKIYPKPFQQQKKKSNADHT